MQMVPRDGVILGQSAVIGAPQSNGYREIIIDFEKCGTHTEELFGAKVIFEAKVPPALKQPGTSVMIWHDHADNLLDVEPNEDLMGFDTRLRRGGDAVEISTDRWARALAEAETYGWTADLPRRWYLHSGVQVSDADAAAMAKAWDRVLEPTGRPHRQEYDDQLERFVSVKNFVRQGGFVIERGVSER